MVRQRKKIAWAVVAGLLLVALAAPYLIPLSTLIPDLEAKIGGRLHEPVKIGQLRLLLLPLPRLVALDVSIGRPSLLHIESLSIRPSIFTLLAATRVISEVKLEGVHAQQALFKRVSAWVKEARAASQRATAAGDPPVLQLRHVTLRDGELVFDKYRIKSLGAEVQLADGKPVEVKATQEGDRLLVSGRPEGADHWTLEIKAKNWTVPVGVPVRFDRLESSVVVNAGGLVARDLTGSLYGGNLAGPIVVLWNQGWSVTGDWTLDKVDVGPLGALLKHGLVVSGRLTARPTFSLHAAAPSGLLESLELESDFSVADGSIQKVDLVAAAKNPLSRDAAKGGKTEFTKLTGHLSVGPTGYEFSDLDVTSGLLAAGGDVSVARDQKLSGRVDVTLRGTASLLSMPLELGGTAQDPSVFPSRAAVAGAVAGSVLLPGIGTAVGIKASQLTEKLFGRKKSPKKAELPPASAPP